jgi:capsular exopolysaccharide synthesis family protein
MSSKLGKKNKLLRGDSIVYDVNNHNWVNESINRLKDNILYWGLDKDRKVIQIESSVSGEAKTTTAVNLAVALGASGKKVIVVDLDFRKPRVHRPFLIENVGGLGDYLLDKIPFEKAIKKTSYDNVYICNRGSSIQSSSFILTSEKMSDFIKHLREEFDFVLLDSPPVLMISDYIHIARLSDGVVFNVASGKTKKNQVKEAINLLKMNNINIIGAVFTFYNPDSSYRGDYYGYGKDYYNKGYGDEK